MAQVGHCCKAAMLPSVPPTKYPIQSSSPSFLSLLALDLGKRVVPKGSGDASIMEAEAEMGRAMLCRVGPGGPGQFLGHLRVGVKARKTIGRGGQVLLPKALQELCQASGAEHRPPGPIIPASQTPPYSPELLSGGNCIMDK